MNKTLSRKDGTPDKSLQEMKEEIQDMLAEMRKRQLEGKKSIAEEEMEYGLAQEHTHSQADPQTNTQHDISHTLQNAVVEKIHQKDLLYLTVFFCSRFCTHHEGAPEKWIKIKKRKQQKMNMV